MSQLSVPSKRLQSLDTLRGFDMFFIMGGDVLFRSLGRLFPDTFWATIGTQMYHKAWNGFAFEDLIFPLFLFIAGISFPFSLAKQRESGKSEADIRRKILSRGLKLVLLGCIYNGLLQFDFEHQRYASVLARIGLAWMFAALLATRLQSKGRMAVVAVLLLGYWALLAGVPAPDAAGAGVFTMEGSLVGYVDRLLLPGGLHGGIHDPEGLLSTLPAVASALLGIQAGEFVRWRKEGLSESRKAVYMALAGVVLIGLAQLWNPLFPINKNLWTSSFVCQAAGWSLLLFSLFYYVIDVREWRRGSFFFTVIGLNSITIYLAQEFIDFWKTSGALFGGVVSLFPESVHGVVASLAYIATCWGFLYFLYRQRIFLKV